MKKNKKGGLKNKNILSIVSKILLPAIVILFLCLVGGQIKIVSLTLKTEGVYKFYEEYNREKEREFERNVKWAEIQSK